MPMGPDTGQPSPPSVVSISSGSLFTIAREAYRRALEATDRETGYAGTHPLVTVVFSTVALEAFINELTALAISRPGGAGPAAASIAAFAAMSQEIEAQRGSTELKFMAAYWTMKGLMPNRGERPWQDFALLLDLRNELVHRKPLYPMRVTPTGGFYSPPRRVITALRSRGVLFDEMTAQQDPPASGDVPVWISTPAMARWSCNTASGMANAVVDLVVAADPGLSALMTVFRRTFQTLD